MSTLILDRASCSPQGYRKQPLTELDAAFESGLLYVVVGKQGSGKKAMLALLSGIAVAAAGAVYYNGEDLKNLDRDKYRSQNVGVVSRGCNLLPGATAIDNVLLSMCVKSGLCTSLKSLSPSSRKKACKLLERVGIPKEKIRKRADTLSAEEIKRVDLACALAHEPNVLLVNDPQNSQDSNDTQSMMDILLMLAHEEKKCVIVTTSSRIVADFADELWGLNGGRLTFIR